MKSTCEPPERPFWDALSMHGERTALVEEDGETLSYRQLDAWAKELAEHIPLRALVFLLCRNSAAAVAGYLAFLQKRAVPVLLNAATDRALLDALRARYRPQFLWSPAGTMQGDALYTRGGYELIASGAEPAAMAGDLALLLSTSGSTGSPKFVRQTAENIRSNTASIVEYLGITPEDRAVTTLPMSYTYGLSIVQSHLMAGASLALTEQTFFDRDFWRFVREQGATTFGAVPYGYQMLDRLRFLCMDLPSLRYLTQAGGRLGAALHEKFARGLREQGKALIVMYGATEATARMSYVPAAQSVEKAGSIGVPIPGGRFELIDEDGRAIEEANRTGELVYYGLNVTPGYAESRADLAKGDERHGRLETGDMAARDEDGYYYVVGRKKRFLKLYGNRVNLTEIEELLRAAGYEAACVGEDDHLRIYTTSGDTEGAVDCISAKTGLNRAAFAAFHLDALPRSEAGKLLYSELK